MRTTLIFSGLLTGSKWRFRLPLCPLPNRSTFCLTAVPRDSYLTPLGSLLQARAFLCPSLTESRTVGLSGSTDREPAPHKQYDVTPLVEAARHGGKSSLKLFVEVASLMLCGISLSPLSRAQVACNGMFGVPLDAPGERSSLIGELRQAEVAVFHSEAWALANDFASVLTRSTPPACARIALPPMIACNRV